MEPSRERDGVVLSGALQAADAIVLQWSRRANATECLRRVHIDAPAPLASMEPSRERDGVI